MKRFKLWHRTAFVLLAPAMMCRAITGSLAAILMLISCSVPVAADEIALESLSTVTTLTPAQARQLVASMRGSTATIDTGKGNTWVKNGARFPGALMLNGLQSLDAETAAVLATYARGPLFLDGLTELDTEAARALQGFQGGPNDRVSFGRGISLAGLTTLSKEAAEALAEFPGDALNLGVVTLSDEAFNALMNTKSRRLYLPRLASLPPGAVPAIRKFGGTSLSVTGLEVLSSEQAAALASLSYKWSGRLPKLTNLSLESAQTLAGFNGTRLEIGTPMLTNETIEALSEFKGSFLLLSGLTELTYDAAMSLSKFSGSGLGLDGMTEISFDLASGLADFNCRGLWLDGLTEISYDAARAISYREPAVFLSLNGLTTLSPEVAQAIAKIKVSELQLRGVAELSQEAAAALVDGCGANNLSLGLTSLSAETAIALANYANNSLFLRNLTTISDEAAIALGRIRCENLWLNELTDLSPQALRGLEAFKGKKFGGGVRLNERTRSR